MPHLYSLSFKKIIYCFFIAIIYSNYISAQTFTFSNISTPSAPTNEACAGDTIKFVYASFQQHPHKIQLRGNMGDTLDIAFDTTSTQGSNNNFQGTVSFRIPPNAITGPVIFLDANDSLLYTPSQVLIIHSPIIDFLSTTDPICADNTTTLLYATPSGGIFRVDTNLVNASFIQQDTLNATLAKWPAHHYRDSMQIDISYEYTAQYTNGVNCPHPKDTTKSITIYDNRLDRINYRTLVRPSGNVALSLDTSISTMITDLGPDIFCNPPTVSCYPHQFSGSFVTPLDSFLSSIAPNTNTVRLEFDNNGCIGTVDGIITIVDTLIAPQIIGLVDTLCKNANSIVLERDSSLVYNQYTTGDSLTGRIITIDTLVSITTSDPNHQSALSINNTTVGQESYNFLPTLLPNPTTEVIITMEYHSINAPRSSFGSPIHIDTLLVTDTITIVTAPASSNITVSNLMNIYCYNDTPTQLVLSYAYLGNSRNTLSLFYGGNPPSTIVLPNDTLNPAYLYNLIGSSTNINLIYEIDYYGCSAASLPISFSITEPLSPNFIDTVYCSNTDTVTLNRVLPISGNITEHFKVHPIATNNPIVDSTIGLFVPNLAALDSNFIVYTQTQTTNNKTCSYTDTGLVYIAAAPQVNLTFDGLVLDTAFCVNEDSVILGTLVQAGTGTGGYSSIYTGASIIDTLFNPSAVFAGMGGDTSIWLVVTDSLGCVGQDSANIIIHELPYVNIDTAFNFVRSAYGATMTDTSDHTYSRASTSFIIDGNPSHTTGLIGTQITGQGVLQLGNQNYYYTPSLVPLSNEVDTVLYYYTDSVACSNIDTTIIKLDSVPSFSPGVTFINFTSGISNIYEACVNDSIILNYDEFIQHPDQIQIKDQLGNALNILVAPSNLRTNTNNSVGGTIGFRIPSNAATSTISFWNGTTPLYSTAYALIVHNPVVDFLAQATPLCADDTNIPLYGTPSGGFFTADTAQTNTSFIINNSINATEAKWPSNHLAQFPINITYNYLPQYSNGNNCADTIQITKALTFYDNRLDNIFFKTIVKQTNGNNNYLLSLDSNNTLISSIQPNILCDGTNCYPHSFSGTYVTNNHVFLGNNASITDPNLVHLEFNNNGCIGRDSGLITVTNFSEIYDLPDTICRGGLASYLIRRDPNLPYGGPVVLANGSTQITNHLLSLTTQDTINQSLIQINNSTVGSEDFNFYSDSISVSNDSFIVFQATYVSYLIDSTRNSIDTTIVDSLVIIDTVFIVEEPTPVLSGVQTTYCANDTLASFQLSPSFLTRFSDFDVASINSNITISDTILNPEQIYNNAVPNRNQDENFVLFYNTDYYGCPLSTFATFTIKEPFNPIFVLDSTYCKNQGTVSLITIPPSNVSTQNSYFIPALGLDSSGNFNTNIADTGSLYITYVLTDNFGCTYTTTDTTFISTPPSIELLLDSSSNDLTLCTNDGIKTISYIADSSLNFNGYTGTGQGVNGNTFDPASAFNGGSGTTTIIASVTNQANCDGTDTLTVTILRPPVVDIATSFNNQTSLDASGAVIANHTYCQNEPRFIITPQPLPSSPTNITGNGIVYNPIDSNYYYEPSIASSTTTDTLIYTYTDTVGCTNTDSTIIKINPITPVSINGSNDTSFCFNDSLVSFAVIPNSSLQGIQHYSGVGIDPLSGIFAPSLAGIGIHPIIYAFTDTNNCTNRDTINIRIQSLPTPAFSGDSSQYCTSAPNDTLLSLNDSSGQFYFYGDLIIDPIGILSPGVDTTSNGTGTKTIYYVYTDSTGCSDTISRNVFIHSKPRILISGLESAYCVNSAQDRISLEPQGGILSNYDSTIFSINNGFLALNPAVTTSGNQGFTYTYTDGNQCSDTLTTQTYIYVTQQSSISGLDSFYCRVNDTIRPIGTPTNGIFSGPGIDADSSYFIPNKASLGQNQIIYNINDAFVQSNGDTLLCSINDTVMVTVGDLPTPRLLSPVNNAQFCSNDSLQLLVADSSAVGVSHRFTALHNGISINISRSYDTLGNTITFYDDTTFYFNPNAVGGGTHVITHIATDSLGCTNSTNTSFLVTEYQVPSFRLDSIQCSSNDSIQLIGLPSGGVFTRDGDTIVNSIVDGFPYFHPNRQDSIGIPLTQSIQDTVIYTIIDGACTASKQVIVTINPSPQLSFGTSTNQNTFCLGGDTVQINTNITGGVLSGNGIRTGSNLFIPDLAGAGFHPIRYYYNDPNTGCDNEFIDTIKVYGMPNLDFSVQGGCQFDSVLFIPNNSVLGLNNIFQNNVIDSITSVKWFFTASDSLVITTVGDTIANVLYNYNSAGIYYPTLIVSNQQYCTDTQTIRLVISPMINSYPYVEDFESSSGGWFADRRDSINNLLWEWGIDSNSLGITANTNNHIWATYTNQGYGPEEDAWVYSPCFDISTLNRPMISLDYWTDTRDRADGSILEYQTADGSWAALGEIGRGINWFNTPFIAGEPGDGSNRDFPIGWSGQNSTWQNGRYKLDNYRGPSNQLRLRIAFASLKNDPQGLYDGFAFDNVIIRNRTRNVLLETMVHNQYSNMELINNKTYQLIHHTNLNKDVTLLQYHIESATGQGSVGTGTDAFYLNNPSLGRTRSYEYGGSPAGRSFINGVDSSITYTTVNLSDIDFEQDMLETPKFAIRIDTFEHVNSNFKIVANVTALETMPSANYRIYTVICEDSLSYPTGSGYFSEIYAVARENDEFHLNPNITTTNLYNNRAWVPNENQRVEFNWDHSSSGFINYQPNHFHAIVFIQNISTKEIFQVATSRDVSGYWVGIDPIKVKDEYNELQSLKLFPNPAHDYFNLQFDQALEHDYDWKLVNMQGLEVQNGNIQSGNDQVQIDGLDYPSGAYILLLYNKNVFVQRQVVLGRP